MMGLARQGLQSLIAKQQAIWACDTAAVIDRGVRTFG